VTDRSLQATGAYARFGVNAKDGIVYFIHRKSPESTDSQRGKDELPKIRSSSDLAWGMWNRADVPHHDIKNIKYFVAVNIINPATAYNIIPKALRLRGEYKWRETVARHIISAVQERRRQQGRRRGCACAH
jgi:hypothetical protein